MIKLVVSGGLWHQITPMVTRYGQTDLVGIDRAGSTRLGIYFPFATNIRLEVECSEWGRWNESTSRPILSTVSFSFGELLAVRLTGDVPNRRITVDREARLGRT